MAARRKPPAPPPLAEGSVDPSPSVLAANDDFIRSEMLRRGAPFCRFGNDDEASRRIRAMSYSLYDAMIAWMGPGADPSFLDFHLLAEVKMPPVVQVLTCRLEVSME
jgi:hypothetical protein